ncbi:MAG: hypothetical protein ACP5QW_09530, partial [bacterium]
KLNHAKVALEAGNTKQAINILSAFVNEVEGLYNVCREHEDHEGDRDRQGNEDKQVAKAMDKGHFSPPFPPFRKGGGKGDLTHNKVYEHENCDKSHLTSEAYALLRYNTEYLIDRLRGKTRGHEKDKDRQDKN